MFKRAQLASLQVCLGARGPAGVPKAKNAPSLASEHQLIKSFVEGRWWGKRAELRPAL